MSQQAVETFTQKRYRCPHCRRSWASITRAREHVAEGCWSDPAQAACKTCKFDVKDYHGVYPNDTPHDGYCSDGHRDGRDWIKGCPFWVPA